MDAAKDSCFPFNVVVLSFPDSRAQDASDGLLQELQARYGETTRFVATTDPYGCRVGSGGGTLQALTQAVTDNNIYPTNDSSSTAATTTSTTTTTTSSSILILHAGGQSSRCPTQMCAGKAATTFPTCHNTKGSTLMTPLHHWLALAGRLFVGLPVGSVVVLASDTLLRVPAVPLPVSSSSSTLDMASSASCSSSSSSDLIDWSSSAAGVVVLTVPAPLSTAQNHGVFVLEEEEDPAVHHSNDAPAASNRLPERQTQRCWTKGCIRVLQKPSLDVLRRQVAGGGDQSKGGDHATTAAWIDTGVLVFLPPAAQALWALTREPALYGCTVQGLQAMHGQQHRQEQQPLPVAGRTTPSSLLPEEDVASFARRGNALSIDLYTHILQALRVTTGKMRWEAYYDRFRHELSAPVARALYQHLCPLELRLWAHPEGRFLHLGTTRELLDFYLASTTTTKQAVTEHTLLLSLFAEDLGLQSRQQVVVSAERGGTVECHAESVLYHSVLSSGLNMSIGKGSLVEFVTLSDCPQAIDIGHGCWVSGLRGHAAQSVRIPDGMVVQEVSLTEKTRVYLVLGVDDPIKSVSTLYGRPLDRVMKAMGLTPRDLWGDREPKDHTLWHAMLHPVLCSDEEGSCHWPQLFDWLSHLDSPDPLVSHPSLAAWKQRERLSLAEIRQRADARVEHAYRESLKNLALPSARLRIRQEVLVHIPRFRESPTGGNSYSRQREVQTSWQKLYPSLESWLQFDMYDLLGSTAMHFANCWDECANEGLPLCTENQSSRDTLARALELVGKYEAFASDEEHAYLQQLVAVADNSIRSLALDGVFSTEDCRTMTRLFRSVVSICTRICIGVPGQDLVPVTRAPIFDSWVLATAPVRIDLAGGWTDTAPICYEHGSVVTGMAVLLDDQKPLACRCRLTRGEPGIFLRSESRDSSEGKIRSTIDANVVNCQDLRGFNDPSSPAALLKCALVIMGIVSPTAILDESSEPIATALQGFFRVDVSVRLEIISTSLLPQGSGMGTSSILAGCILAAIAHCRGRPLTTERLIHLVLLLEQCLTTGGGFQDQANGLVGGVKRVSCAAVCPVRIKWKKLLLTPSTEKRLNDRICIVFTGKTRLAKNILQQCLRRWSERTVEICRTVSDLESTAEVASRSLEDGDLERLGRCLTEYWGQKKVMAGAASGVEPTSVGSILDILYQEKLIRGGALAGAGGGGFLILLMKDDTTREDMTASLYRSGLDTTSLSWHGSRIDNEGLSVRCPDEDDFELSWMQGASPVDAS